MVRDPSIVSPTLTGVFIGGGLEHLIGSTPHGTGPLDRSSKIQSEIPALLRYSVLST